MQIGLQNRKRSQTHQNIQNTDYKSPHKYPIDSSTNLMTFPSAQFGGWLFYSILFISFTPTLLHQANPKNGKTLLDIIIESTENMQNVAFHIEMSTEMHTLIGHFGQLAGISDEFMRMKNLAKKATENLRVIEAVKKHQMVVIPKEMGHIHDYLTMKERINPDLIDKTTKELREIEANGTETEAQNDKLALYKAFLEILNITMDKTKPFIDNLVSKSAQFLRDHKETQKMLYTYADLYDWMYLMYVSKLLKVKLVSYYKYKQRLENADDLEQIYKILALTAIFEDTLKKMENREKQHKETLYEFIPNVKQREEILADAKNISVAMKQVMDKNPNPVNATKVKDVKEEFESQIHHDMDMKRIDLQMPIEHDGMPDKIKGMAKCLVEVVYYEWAKKEVNHPGPGRKIVGENAEAGVETENVKALEKMKVDQHQHEAGHLSNKLKKTHTDEENV